MSVTISALIGQTGFPSGSPVKVLDAVQIGSPQTRQRIRFGRVSAAVLDHSGVKDSDGSPIHVGLSSGISTSMPYADSWPVYDDFTPLTFDNLDAANAEWWAFVPGWAALDAAGKDYIGLRILIEYGTGSI